MCELHTYSVSRVSKRYDPTRTTVLRNTMVRDSNRRFDKIASEIKKAVDDNDVFGLKIQENVVPGKLAFAYALNMQKVEEFNRWFQQLINDEIINVVDIPRIGSSIVPEWTNKYITEAYRRGIVRARQEMKKAGYPVPDIALSGGLAGAFAVPLHVDAVGFVYIRAFNELKGITSAMEQQISRILAQGLIDGTNPLRLARKLVAAINGKGVGELGITDTLGRFIPAKRRAEILARTEIIRAHHYANIMEYKNWGVVGVNIIAEWKTAGDESVCPICDALEGQRFTLDEILPMIPRHPQCRCIALPIAID